MNNESLVTYWHKKNEPELSFSSILSIIVISYQFRVTSCHYSHVSSQWNVNYALACVCNKNKTWSTNGTLLFTTTNHATSTSQLPWHHKMKKVWQRCRTFLYHLLALPQRQHLPLPSPSAAVQPHQCQVPVPWRRAAAAGWLGLGSLIGARGCLPLLLQLCCRWLTVGSKPRLLATGQRSPGGCSACMARGGLRCDGRRIRQRCPAVCMNSDWRPQLLSLSLSVNGKRKWCWCVDKVWNPSVKYAQCNHHSLTAKSAPTWSPQNRLFLPACQKPEHLGKETVWFSLHPCWTAISRIHVEL